MSFLATRNVTSGSFSCRKGGKCFDHTDSAAGALPCLLTHSLINIYSYFIAAAGIKSSGTHYLMTNQIFDYRRRNAMMRRLSRLPPILEAFLCCAFLTLTFTALSSPLHVNGWNEKDELPVTPRESPEKSVLRRDVDFRALLIKKKRAQGTFWAT